ncbi:MAG: sigma-70 family RNA polymerase sigma factor [Vicinamibacterales bacterium]|nr:sigma-70 family RNA polymerase sigma factor [Vicinamibacterales bacterium]
MATDVTEVLAQNIRPEWSVRVVQPGATAEVDLATLASLDEPALVALCLSGRREAFDVIVEKHRRAVYQLCYRFVGNHEDASDLAQDAFIRAFRGLERFRGQSALGTWLYRIAVNVCLNRVSAKQPQTEPLDVRPHIDQRAIHPDSELLRGERAEQVRAAIAQLPKKQRATVILRVYHELSHEEIAGVLGSSVGAVKANFFHALGNLKKLL